MDEDAAKLWADARARWPGVADCVTVERFGAHLAATGADPGHAAEVYLTLACAEGDPAAIAAFEHAFLAGVRSPLARMGLTASQIDETLQVMRAELLVRRASAPARILGYGGRGHLGGWVRAVAARTGLRTLGHPERHDALLDEHGALGGAGGGAVDLEIAFMKKTYGEAFQRAFRAALAGLPDDDRLLLKQRFRHAMTVEELGALYAVHAGTISRRVAAARERLVARTRDEMVAQLGVARAEVSSILRMIHSQLDVSLGTIDESLAR